MSEDSFKAYRIQQIQMLYEELVDSYQENSADIARVAEWEENLDVTILGQLEIYTIYILGYASQIVTTGHIVETDKENMKFLQTFPIYDIDYVASWYWQSAGEFAQLKQYLQRSDYLRLLVLHYYGSCSRATTSAGAP
jgi:hypothetical protein